MNYNKSKTARIQSFQQKWNEDDEDLDKITPQAQDFDNDHTPKYRQLSKEQLLRQSNDYQKISDSIKHINNQSQDHNNHSTPDKQKQESVKNVTSQVDFQNLKQNKQLMIEKAKIKFHSDQHSSDATKLQEIITKAQMSPGNADQTGSNSLKMPNRRSPATFSRVTVNLENIQQNYPDGFTPYRKVEKQYQEVIPNMINLVQLNNKNDRLGLWEDLDESQIKNLIEYRKISRKQRKHKNQKPKIEGIIQEQNIKIDSQKSKAKLVKNQNILQSNLDQEEESKIQNINDIKQESKTIVSNSSEQINRKEILNSNQIQLKSKNNPQINFEIHQIQANSKISTNQNQYLQSTTFSEIKDIASNLEVVIEQNREQFSDKNLNQRNINELQNDENYSKSFITTTRTPNDTSQSFFNNKSHINDVNSRFNGGIQWMSILDHMKKADGEDRKKLRQLSVLQIYNGRASKENSGQNTSRDRSQTSQTRMTPSPSANAVQSNARKHNFNGKKFSSQTSNTLEQPSVESIVNDSYHSSQIRQKTPFQGHNFKDQVLKIKIKTSNNSIERQQMSFIQQQEQQPVVIDRNRLTKELIQRRKNLSKVLQQKSVVNQEVASSQFQSDVVSSSQSELNQFTNSTIQQQDQQFFQQDIVSSSILPKRRILKASQINQQKFLNTDAQQNSTFNSSNMNTMSFNRQTPQFTQRSNGGMIIPISKIQNKFVYPHQNKSAQVSRDLSPHVQQNDQKTNFKVEDSNIYNEFLASAVNSKTSLENSIKNTSIKPINLNPIFDKNFQSSRQNQQQNSRDTSVMRRRARKNQSVTPVPEMATPIMPKQIRSQSPYFQGIIPQVQVNYQKDGDIGIITTLRTPKQSYPNSPSNGYQVNFNNTIQNQFQHNAQLLTSQAQPQNVNQQQHMNQTFNTINMPNIANKTHQRLCNKDNSNRSISQTPNHVPSLHGPNRHQSTMRTQMFQQCYENALQDFRAKPSTSQLNTQSHSRKGASSNPKHRLIQMYFILDNSNHTDVWQQSSGRQFRKPRKHSIVDHHKQPGSNSNMSNHINQTVNNNESQFLGQSQPFFNSSNNEKNAIL